MSFCMCTGSSGRLQERSETTS